MKTIYITFLLFTLRCAVSSAQPVLVQDFVEAGGLVCFPVLGDSNVFKYLPSVGKIATNPEDLPEFSFLQYALVNNDSKTTGSSVTEANGGGLLHFLVLYDTPEEQVRNAEREIRRKLKRSKIVLTGPVDISTGKFMLVSSLLIDGKEQKEILGTGIAPVFENSKVAFSFLVDPLKSKLLMESFKMATPDISITFDLQFSGLTSAYNGKVTVDWAKVQDTEYSNSSVDAIFYSSDVEKAFGSMIQTGAIQMETYGSDSIASEMLTIAYDRLVKLMFDPVMPDSVPSEDNRGVLGEIFGRRGLLGGLVGGSNVYKRHVVKTSGHTVVQINTRKMVDRHHLLTFNIGDLYKKYADNPRIFRKVALDDPAFQQREVRLNLDGDIKNEFDRMINSVSVTMKKKHGNGEETIKEVFVSKDVLKDYTGNTKLIYLNKEDADRTEWLNYEYMITWQFKKDGSYNTSWIPANSPIINLFTPYKYRDIEVLGDLNALHARGVVAVAVEVEYPFFGKMKKDRLTVMTDDKEGKNKIEAILPSDVESVDYKVTWIFKDGKKDQRQGKDEFGVILIDEVSRIKTMHRFLFLAIVFLVSLPETLSGQTLSEVSELGISIGKGDVKLFHSRDCRGCYYYLPCNYHISTKGSRRAPEISLVTWKDDDAGEIEGGILHFLIQWGLTAEDEKNITKILRADRDSTAVLMGSAIITSQSGPDIVGDDNLATILRESLTNTPGSPTTPGSKVAFSFKLSKKQIATFLFYKKNPTKTKTQLQGTYSYEVEARSGARILKTLVVTLQFSDVLTLIK